MTGWVSKEGSEGMSKGYKKESHTPGGHGEESFQEEEREEVAAEP